MASTSLRISITLHCATSSQETCFARCTPTNCFLARQPPRLAGLTFSTRRRESVVTSKKIIKKKSAKKNVGDVDEEDAFDALFHQLEQDLKNDELNGNDGGDDDDISEEELAKLEQELVEALGDDELLGALGLAVGEEIESEDGANEEDEYEDDEEEDEVEQEEEEEPIKLKNWQLKRLAYALKDGRRKTNIKNLAADLCLDRAIVLKLLRDPPPNLVMLSATLPDKPPPTTILNPVQAFPLETVTDNEKPEEVKEKVPVHVMQSNWSARKRLKKVQVDTLEAVYKRTKRPTNTMVSSIVHVTNLPRKKVVKWFEDKRADEGVPQHRLPYQRLDPEESVFTS